LKLSDDGLAFIKKHEGCRYHAYLDSGGVPTIGVGHTGLEVRLGMEIDDEEVDRLLRLDVETAEKCVNNCVRVPITQSQFDALVSFTFNVGCGALGKSTLLKHLNDGQDDLAAREFTRWVKVRSKVVAGLVKRREAERDLFLS
jgi:lysozyme